MSASSIGEPAIYKWYNPQDSLIHTGSSINVSPKISSRYKLEVIAKADGFKDYDSVEVDVKHKWLKSLNPNPTSSQATVVYDLKPTVQSAYISITPINGTTFNNYILDVNKEKIQINFSNYQTGVYAVTLVADGVIRESQNLLIQ